jgi:hypothetical protein
MIQPQGGARSTERSTFAHPSDKYIAFDQRKPQHPVPRIINALPLSRRRSLVVVGDRRWHQRTPKHVCGILQTRQRLARLSGTNGRETVSLYAAEYH